MSEANSRETIRLPRPALRSDRSLEEALAARRSVRGFLNTPLTDAQLAQLAWAAQGLVHPGGLRTAPSAGAHAVMNGSPVSSAVVKDQLLDTVFGVPAKSSAYRDTATTDSHANPPMGRVLAR